MTHLIRPNLDKEIYHSPSFSKLLDAQTLPGDCGNPAKPPKWLDYTLFEQGKEFYRKYQFCIFFAEILGLMVCFSIPRIRIPLMLTKNSDTPDKTRRRYVSTALHIMAWYQKDVWTPTDEGYKDLLKVRSIHRTVSRECKRACKGVIDLDINPSYVINGLVREDLNYMGKEYGRKIEGDKVPIEYLSQMDMVVIQYAFIGLVFTQPRILGLWWVTENELKGFIHFWRGIGWLLGIDDKYNLCNGSVQDVRSLCLDIEDSLLKPSLLDVSDNFEVMSEALMKGINTFIPCVSFPSMLLYILSTLNLQTPRLRRHFGYQDFLNYWLMHFVFGFLFVVPYFIPIFNCLLNLALSSTSKRNTSKVTS